MLYLPTRKLNFFETRFHNLLFLFEHFRRLLKEVDKDFILNFYFNQIINFQLFNL